MPTVSGPIIPRQRLASELRRLRTEAGLSLEEVATRLMISTSKLSRLENAQGSPQARDVRDLIRLYDVEDTPVADRMMRWVRAARRQGWWNDYSYSPIGWASDIETHVAYESEATVSRVYAIPFLPALLQSPEYLRALHHAMEPWRSDQEVEQLVLLRQRRQELLKGGADRMPLRLSTVAHETGLRQMVGSPEIMSGQMDRIDDYFDWENVEIRVLPFSVSPPFTVSCMWTYFEYADELDRDVVHIETHAGFRYIETAEQVEQYRRHFTELVRRSLGVEESRRLVRAAGQSWRDQS